LVALETANVQRLALKTAHLAWRHAIFKCYLSMRNNIYGTVHVRFCLLIWNMSF